MNVKLCLMGIIFDKYLSTFDIFCLITTYFSTNVKQQQITIN